MVSRKKSTKGKYVVVRATAAGVHAGVLIARKGDEVQLADSRRLWLWRVPKGKPDFLSGVATHGLGDGCKIGCPVSITINGACEVIDCTADAESSIRGYASHAS